MQQLQCPDCGSDLLATIEITQNRTVTFYLDDDTSGGGLFDTVRDTWGHTSDLCDCDDPECEESHIDNQENRSLLAHSRNLHAVVDLGNTWSTDDSTQETVVTVVRCKMCDYRMDTQDRGISVDIELD